MGSIHFSGLRLLESLSEIVGYKAGVAMGRDDLNHFFREDRRFTEFVDAEDTYHFRIHSSKYEEIVEALLYKLGRLERPTNHLPGISLFHKYKNDKKLAAISMAVSEAFAEWLNSAVNKAQVGEKLDPTPYAEECARKFGHIGLEMAVEMIDALIAYQTISPWMLPAESEWVNTIELRHLFESERLESAYGNFSTSGT